ncbi:Uma2 family endonuclease [Microcoleus sp. Pol12B4]|uniref:Uma2 family endonuclease n=1 Tax=Microcoleus sp. Pol12B4 TaxID=3055395 RepID=UPI002FD2ED82
MLTISTPAEQRVLLPNISWQLYESLLAELGNKRSTRIAYHQGQLEIMVPLPEHENRHRLIVRLIVTLIEELNLEYNPFGSMTIKKRQKAAGKEPDSCYYIQNEALVRKRTKLDFAQDPPPDLALEIDITSSSLNQFDLYADLGVPEIWRYDGRNIKFYQLQNGEYAECNFSRAFPMLPTAKVEEFIDRCQTTGATAAVRKFRQWVKDQ